jgi:FixJ family two-component response regulator
VGRGSEEVDGIPLIAVVDDDEGVRRSLDGLVRSLGYRVAIFPSAEAFLSSAELKGSACIISDVQMPGMSGLELAGVIAASGVCIPIILMSAFLDDRVTAQASAAGARWFLRKPFDGDCLVSCLDLALNS